MTYLRSRGGIFEIQGQSFLLVGDYLSKYPEVLNVKGKSSHTVANKMKSVFSRFRIPKEIVTLILLFSPSGTRL